MNKKEEKIGAVIGTVIGSHIRKFTEGFALTAGGVVLLKLFNIL